MNKISALCAALLLAACSGNRPAPPLAGARIGGPFALTDQNGHATTDRAFAGKYRIMYFGYTFCPDICPVDLQMLAAGLKAFAARDPVAAAKVVPIFVSVDPDRDTPAVLKDYLANFGPQFVGLTGSRTQVDAAKKVYAVFSSKGPAQAGGGYPVNHSRVEYLFGPDGKPIALLPQEGPPEAIAAELAKWVH
jgi:protein SCO1